MTKPNAPQTTEPTEGATEQPPATDPSTETAGPVPAPPASDSETTRPDREAAKYRRQLRDVETERDTLRERVETMQRAEVERIAGRTIAKPAGVWAAVTKLEDVLDDAGQVDEGKVTTAVKTAADTLGLALKRGPGSAPLAGRTPERRSKSGNFAGAFGPAD